MPPPGCSWAGEDHRSRMDRWDLLWFATPQPTAAVLVLSIQESPRALYHQMKDSIAVRQLKQSGISAVVVVGAPRECKKDRPFSHQQTVPPTCHAETIQSSALTPAVWVAVPDMEDFTGARLGSLRLRSRESNPSLPAVQTHGEFHIPLIRPLPDERQCPVRANAATDRVGRIRCEHET